MNATERGQDELLDVPQDDDVGARRVAALTRERDAALAAAAVERARNAVLIQQCERLASEIFALRRGQAPLWTSAIAAARARQLTAELEYARATIRNMERSWFWRLRLLSVRIRQMARGARDRKRTT
jgi:hypothetical protein